MLLTPENHSLRMRTNYLIRAVARPRMRLAGVIAISEAKDHRHVEQTWTIVYVILGDNVAMHYVS